MAALIDSLRVLGHEVIVVRPASYAALRFGEQRSAVARLRAALRRWL
jgi:hypothetical protein